MFKKILVPLDGSPMAEKVLPQVAELAGTTKARVTLMHVCHGRGREVTGEDAAGAGRPCEKFLAQGCTDLEAQGLKADWVCRVGGPAREIIAFAQDHDYDLIALGTHGKGEVAWNLGGVADKVAAHATVPVLLFRTFSLRPMWLKPKMKKLVKEAELYFAWSIRG
jgi:nucleotide-binding universal stress UspA family protein